MEEVLKYEIKISVYESGVSRIVPIKDVHPEQVKGILLQHANLIERAIIKNEVIQMLQPKPTIGKLPTAEDIMRTKQ